LRLHRARIQRQRPARGPPATAAAAAVRTKPKYEYSYRDPAPWPKDIPLPQHDEQEQPYVDLVIAGAGPSGVAVAARVARQGFKVCVIDPDPLGVWPNNYGVWVDEFDAMGLRDCLEVVWPKAKVWLDNDKHGEK
jgi:lycopene beta-cyclase